MAGAAVSVTEVPEVSVLLQSAVQADRPERLTVPEPVRSTERATVGVLPPDPPPEVLPVFVDPVSGSAMRAAAGVSLPPPPPQADKASAPLTSA